MTNLGENEAVCDVCGRLSKRNELVEIPDPFSNLILHAHRECLAREPLKKRMLHEEVLLVEAQRS